VLEGAFTNTAPQGVSTVPLTVSKAVGAGGINVEQADLSGLTLIRDGRRYNIDLDRLNRQEGSGDIYLKPGDRRRLRSRPATCRSRRHWAAQAA
jgi:polysaccharide biosynthesis/export protein